MKRSLFAELKRRNVIRAAVLYIGAVWAFGQGLSQFSPALGLPDWATGWFLVAACIGFPFWIAFAWFYEFTPEGLKRESEIDPAESITAHTGRTMDRWIIAVMAVAIVLLLTNTFVWHKGAGLNGGADNMKAPPNSIAVLPFADESPKKDQGYFSDGISEDLLNLLTKVPQLQVTARTSSFAFKGKDLGVPEIARRLHVSHVLQGSVQKAGDEIRITAQLVDAGTDAQLWSQTWDRKLNDIFKIQDEISGDVVKQLKVKLLGAEPKAISTDPQAYALYLQAKELGRQSTAEAFKLSDALYHQALAIDPRYAPAWAELALNVLDETGIGMLSNQEGFARAREALQKALSIDPVNLAVLGNAGTLLGNLGRLDEAIALKEALVRRDPVNVTALGNLGYYQREAGRYDAAIATYRTALSLSPGNGGAHYGLGLVLLLKGDAQGALAEIEQETNEVYKMIGLPLAYYALGRKADSDAALTALIAKYEKDAPYNIAYVYAYRGEADKAFKWLDKALEYKDPGIGEIVEEDLFDKIHSDPRWLPFLRKLGKAPEQLAMIKFKVNLPKAWQTEASTESAPQP